MFFNFWRNREEKQLCLLAALYHGLIMAGFFVLKPARDAEFLTNLGSQNLPYLYITLGIITSVVIAGLSRMVKDLPIGQVAAKATLFIVVLNFFLWGIALFNPAGYFYWFFYIWVTLLGLILPIYAWNLWKEIFTLRQARRIYWFIGLGSSSGALIGSLTSIILTNIFPAMMLIPIASLFLFGAWTALYFLKKVSPSPWKLSSTAFYKSFATTRHLPKCLRSNYLLYTAAAVLTIEFISTLAEFWLQTTVESSFNTTETRAQFFAQFFSAINFLQLVVQAFLARILIRRLGIRWTLMVLPAVLFVIALGLPALPVLGGIMLFRGSDSLLRHTLYKTSFEFLYIPIPKELTQAFRGPIESLAQRLGTALAGIFVIFLPSVFSTDWPWHYGMLCAALGATIMIHFNLQKKYLTALESTFEVPLTERMRDINIHVDTTDLQLKKKLTRDLKSADVHTVLNALSFIEILELFELLTPQILEHPAASVRLKTLQLLDPKHPVFNVKSLQKMITDPHPEVRAEAIHFSCVLDPDQSAGLVEPYLHSSDPVVQAQAALCLMRGSGAKKLEAQQVLLSMNQSANPALRKESAVVASIGDFPSGSDRLKNLLNDPVLEVRLAAISRIGEAGQINYLKLLIPLLGNASLRNAVKDAMVGMGEQVVGLLLSNLKDPAIAKPIRRRIIWTLGHLSCKKSVETVQSYLDNQEVRSRYMAIKALNRLSRTLHDIQLDPARIKNAIKLECAWYWHLARDQENLTNVNLRHAATQLLLYNFKDHLGWTVERIFRLLGLLYDQKTIHAAYASYISSSKKDRDYALEFIENRVEHPLNEIILDILVLKNKQKPRFMDKNELLNEIMTHSDQTSKKLSNFLLENASSFPS